MMSLDEFLAQKTKEKKFAIHLMTSYPETLTAKKLIKMGFFIINIYYISSSNDPNITHTVPKIILVVSCTLKFQSEHTKMCGFGKIEPVAGQTSVT